MIALKKETLHCVYKKQKPKLLQSFTFLAFVLSSLSVRAAQLYKQARSSEPMKQRNLKRKKEAKRERERDLFAFLKRDIYGLKPARLPPPADPEEEEDGIPLHKCSLTRRRKEKGWIESAASAAGKK